MGRAVEQLAVCLAKQAKVSSRGESTTIIQRGTCGERSLSLLVNAACAFICAMSV